MDIARVPLVFKSICIWIQRKFVRPTAGSGFESKFANGPDPKFVIQHSKQPQLIQVLTHDFMLLNMSAYVKANRPVLWIAFWNNLANHGRRVAAILAKFAAKRGEAFIVLALIWNPVSLFVAMAFFF